MRRLLKLAEKSSSSSKAKDEASAIVAESMNATTPTAKPVTRTSKPIQKGIVIREPEPQ